MNITEYLQKYNSANITEAVRNRDVDKAIRLMRTFLLKKNVYLIPDMLPLQKDGNASFGIMGFNDKNFGVCFVWTRDDSARIDSILFTKNYDAASVAWANNDSKYIWDVAVDCKGANLVKITYLVDKVMNGKLAMTAAAINADLADAQLFESVDESVDESEEDVINSLKNTIAESLINEVNDPTIDKLVKQKNALYHRIRSWGKKGKDVADLQQQYDDLAKQISDAKLAVRDNVPTQFETDKDVETLNKYFEEEERATPEERFEDMASYIDSVIYGIKPLAVICGAPGVGKTFRIMQALKKNGKHMGSEFGLIKGKCTAQNFYMMLHDYKNDGQLLVLDDADEIVKDDVAINLIKAACDSSDERWVSYGTSRPPFMDPEKAEFCDDAQIDDKGRWMYPKEFETHGGMIIITNMGAGQIDTAIKNRALMCDLNFTVYEVLDLVEGIAPKIKPDLLTPEAKQRALDYLHELADNKVPMEISIRSFTLVAGMYMSDAPEKAIQRRIREQMKLQFARGGKKY